MSHLTQSQIMETKLTQLKQLVFDAAVIANSCGQLDDPRANDLEQIENQLDAIRYQIHDLQD